MPVTLELQENGRVLIYTFVDPWEIGDLIALYPQSQEYLRTAQRKIYTLADVRRAKKIPSGILNLRHGPDWSHPNGGTVAIVGANGLLRTFASIVFRLSGFEHATYYDSVEEAWAYLRSVLSDEPEASIER